MRDSVPLTRDSGGGPKMAPESWKLLELPRGPASGGSGSSAPMGTGEKATAGPGVQRAAPWPSDALTPQIVAHAGSGHPAPSGHERGRDI
eukprot:352893-Chlamydomonas_euryale.AAC.4